MRTPRASGPLDFPRGGRLWRGSLYFAAFTAIGLGLVFASTGGAETWAALHDLRTTFLGLTVVGCIADTLIGALRYHIFLKRVKPEAGLWLPIRADLAGRFIGAVTPSQSGGGPAQVYVFYRGGVGVPESLSFLAINFLATMAFFLVAGGLGARAVGGASAAGAVGALIRFGFVAVSAVGTFVLLALLRPDLIERAGTATLGRLGKPTGNLSGSLRKAALWVVNSVQRYRSACLLFIREAPSLLLWSILLTVVLYVNKFTIAYFVLRGFGVDAPYFDVLAMQALLQLVLYVAPSPGGSGIGELSTAALMTGFMEAHLLGAFTLVFRFFQMYLPAAVGCVVLLHSLRPAALVKSVPSTASAPASSRALHGGAA